jgi:hypothetical protein
LIAATEHQAETEALARKLTDGLHDKAQKIVTLRDWVARNLRQDGPLLTHLPLTAITPADQTLRERYGNNSDRMVVLYTLLKAAKIKPEFVLSGGISLISEEAEPLISVPSRSAFNTVLVKTEIDGKTIYLDAASHYAELGTSAFHRRPVLDLEKGEIGTIEVEPGKDNRKHSLLEMAVAANGETGFTESATIQGTDFDGFHRNYAEITPEKRRRHYLEMVTKISQSAKSASELITEYDTYPGKIEFSAFAERYAVSDGDYLYFTAPAGLGDTLLTYRSSHRSLPLAWNNHIDSVIEINIVLPDGYEPVIMPGNFSWQAPNGAGMVEVAVEYSPRANAIRIVQMADLRPALIPAGEFPNIIKAGRRLSHPDMRTILLKKKQAE